jgi:hypothetical protein
MSLNPFMSSSPLANRRRGRDERMRRYCMMAPGDAGRSSPDDRHNTDAPPGSDAPAADRRRADVASALPPEARAADDGPEESVPEPGEDWERPDQPTRDDIIDPEDIDPQPVEEPSIDEETGAILSADEQPETQGMDTVDADRGTEDATSRGVLSDERAEPWAEGEQP